MTTPTRILPISLSCGHKAIFPQPTPFMGERVYCRQCNGYATVIVTDLKLRLFCSHTFCTAGMPVEYAENKVDYACARAVTHVMHHHQHAVRIYQGPEYRGTVIWEDKNDRSRVVESDKM